MPSSSNFEIIPFFYGIAVLLLLAWGVFLLKLFRTARRIPNLNTESMVCRMETCPSVSVIVAARNEELSIESCVRSILTQRYPRLELIVINDRSTDHTQEILQSLAQEFTEHLKIITIEHVPEGWGGQNNALYQGVTFSSGEWLCFTDADCQFSSEHTLAICTELLQSKRLDMLSVLPDLCFRTVWEKMYLPLCSLVMLGQLRLHEVNSPAQDAAYANGAFMIMRRSVYQDLGGHASVRDQVNDDVSLARHAKQQGYALCVASNDRLIETKMYDSINLAWSGWIRNFSGTLQRTSRLLWAWLATTTLFVLPWLGVITVGLFFDVSSHWPLLALWTGVVAFTHLAMWVVYRHYPIAARWSLAYLPGALFVSVILAASAFQVWRKRAFMWQGVNYTR